MRSGSTMSLSKRSKMPIPSEPSVNREQSSRVCDAAFTLAFPPGARSAKRTRVYGVEVDVDGLRSVGVDLHHG